MFVQKITIQYQRKINLGDYNQIVLSAMPTIVLDVDDDIDETLKAAWAMCRSNVEHAAAPIIRGYKVGNKHGVTTQELFLGMPIDEADIHVDYDGKGWVAEPWENPQGRGETPEKAVKNLEKYLKGETDNAD